jgi:hypothetical protein
VIATLRFTLPDEQADFDAALLGSEARQVLWQIDQWCRNRIRHEQPTADEVHALEAVQAMIPAELLDI